MVIKSQLWKLVQKRYNGHVEISYRLRKWLDYLNSNPWHLLERHLVRKVACGGGEDPKRVECTLECGLSSKEVRWQEEGRGLTVWGKMWAGSRRSYVTVDLLRERAQSTFSLEEIFFLDLSLISPSLSEMCVFCCSNLYLQEVDVR